MFETNDDIELYTGEKLKVSQTATCKTEDVTYVCICSGCMDFYFGQTMSQFNVRMNGHRGKFDVIDDKYKKSALSFHIYEDHFDEFGCKTKFCNCATLDLVDPNRLNQRILLHIIQIKPVSITDADFADGIALLRNDIRQADELLKRVECSAQNV